MGLDSIIDISFITVEDFVTNVLKERLNIRRECLDSNTSQ